MSTLRHIPARSITALKNAFASPGFRRFGWPFVRDYLRLAWSSARSWGDQSPGVVSWMGHQIHYANRSAVVFLVHEIFVHCTYDFEPSRPDPLILDCGANLGMAALFFRLRFPGARIISVEPHPAAFKLLEANTASDPAISRLEVAITESGESTPLFAPDGQPSLISRITPDVLNGAPIMVAAMRLSALLNSLSEDVDLLKLDLEGAEYGALRECHQMGALARVREVSIEFHRSEAQPEGPEALAQILRASGFGGITVADSDSGVDGMIRARRLAA